MVVLARRKRQVYVEIDLRKSKLHKNTPPLHRLSPRAKRHLWAKGTPVRDIHTELDFSEEDFAKLTVGLSACVRVSQCMRCPSISTVSAR